uniref:GTP-binding protein n=2 Tax=Ditylum brightwellii TaxID=49249 RepID=A0A7S4SLD7_9STRA
MSPHETLFRLEATQHLERAVVDHTPLCRFTIWDFPGDYYGPGPSSPMFAGGVGLGAGNNNIGTTGAQVRGVDGGYYGGTVDGMMGDGGRGGVAGGPMNYSGDAQQGGANNGGVTAQNMHTPGGINAGVDGTLSNEIPSSNNGDGTNNGVDNGETDNGAAPNTDDGDAYVFGRATALIFVIDAQDEPYDHVLQNFTETVTRAVRANPHIVIEVFINKVDGELFLSDEAKYECRRDMMQQVSDELADAGVMPDAVPISYHLTSIYDHSVFEAFSRVVQKLIPQLPTLENLLNVLVSTCSMEKAYLFDVASKLYISTDSSPVDMQSVELCSDMIDVVLDVSGIYGLRAKDTAESNGGAGNNAVAGATAGDVASSLDNTNEIGSLSSDHNPPEKVMESITTASADGTGDLSNHVAGGDLLSSEGYAADAIGAATGGSAEGTDELVGTLISQQAGGGISGPDDEGDEEEEVDADTAYDNESSSVIRLSNGMVSFLTAIYCQ